MNPDALQLFINSLCCISVLHVVIKPLLLPPLITWGQTLEVLQLLISDSVKKWDTAQLLSQASMNSEWKKSAAFSKS